MIFHSYRQALLVMLSLLLIPLDASYCTNDDIEQFYRTGYLLKKQAIAPSTLQLLNTNSTLLLEKVLSALEDYPYQAEEQTALLEGSHIVFLKRQGKPIAIQRIVGVCAIAPTLQKVLRSKKMLHTYFALLDTTCLEQLICQFHPKLPGDGVSFNKHQDLEHRKYFDPNWQDIGEKVSYAVCLLAIDPMTEENGCLYIDPRSYQSQDKDPFPIIMEPGDLLFIHPQITHWSGENRSNISRRALLTGYCIYGANHENYPGNCTNDVFHKNSSLARPAPWKAGVPCVKRALR
ncbi:MAG: phytanoyl-CoA dioxygenase family protein [Chlamydiota bacterium]